MEVTVEANLRWNVAVDAQMQHMIWSHSGSNSHYENKTGRNFMSWPFRLVDYWRHSRGPVIGDLDVR